MYPLRSDSANLNLLMMDLFSFENQNLHYACYVLSVGKSLEADWMDGIQPTRALFIHRKFLASCMLFCMAN